MKPRELFGVAVRVIGFWFLTQAFYWFFWFAVKAHDPHAGNPNIPNAEDLESATLYILLGGVTLLLADLIVWAIYGLPPRPASSDADDAASGDTTPGE